MGNAAAVACGDPKLGIKGKEADLAAAAPALCTKGKMRRRLCDGDRPDRCERQACRGPQG